MVLLCLISPAPSQNFTHAWTFWKGKSKHRWNWYAHQFYSGHANVFSRALNVSVLTVDINLCETNNISLRAQRRTAEVTASSLLSSSQAFYCKCLLFFCSHSGCSCSTNGCRGAERCIQGLCECFINGTERHSKQCRLERGIPLVIIAVTTWDSIRVTNG